MVNVSGFANSLEEWIYKHQGAMMKFNAFMAEVALMWVKNVRKVYFYEQLVYKSKYTYFTEICYEWYS